MGLRTYTVFFKCPYKKKSNAVKSRDLADHGITPWVPIHRLGKISFKYYLTMMALCAGVPSY